MVYTIRPSAQLKLLIFYKYQKLTLHEDNSITHPLRKFKYFDSTHSPRVWLNNLFALQLPVKCRLEETLFELYLQVTLSFVYVASALSQTAVFVFSYLITTHF